MLRSTAIIACLFLTTLTTAISAETHSITLDHVEGTHTIGDTTYLVAGQVAEFHLRFTNNGTPDCFFNPSMAFQISSADGAEWGDITIEPIMLIIDEVVLGIFVPSDFLFTNLFDMTFSAGYSITGADADTITFAALSFGTPISPFTKAGLFDSLDHNCLIVKIRPTAASAGNEICLDTVNGLNGYEWGWYGTSVDPSWSADNCLHDEIIPDWGGPYNFPVISCCGLYTGGESGNIDCDQDGNINLADITRLIDYIYLTKEELCCVTNGNIDGDDNGDINLADITQLIDRVYISHQPNSNCQ